MIGIDRNGHSEWWIPTFANVYDPHRRQGSSPLSQARKKERRLPTWPLGSSRTTQLQQRPYSSYEKKDWVDRSWCYYFITIIVIITAVISYHYEKASTRLVSLLINFDSCLFDCTTWERERDMGDCYSPTAGRRASSISMMGIAGLMATRSLSL